MTALLRALVAHPLRRRRARRVSALMESAARLQADGNRQGVLAALEAAATLDPGNAAVHGFMGRAHAESGAYDSAKASFRRVIELEPERGEAHIDLGTVHRLERDLVCAEQAYRRALVLAPAAPLAHYNLALILLQRRATGEAAQHLRAAHAALPGSGEMLKLLVSTLIETGQCDEALAIAATAAAATPSCESRFSLGRAHHALHHFECALRAYDEALPHAPADPELHTRRAITLQDSGRIAEAIAGYDAALAVQPDYALARFHRALAHLLLGDYGAGWPDYESRLVSADIAPRAASLPRWSGGGLEGKALRVYAEQGLGDQIMFASCLPDLMQAAGHCTVECVPTLTGLFRRSFPGARVVPMDGALEGKGTADPGGDFEVPLGSLPLYFRKSLADFPRHGGYLVADPSRVERWKATLAQLGPGPKIGISWRGGTHQSRSPLRSIMLDEWQPVLETPGVNFVSLQYTAGAQDEVRALQARGTGRVVHWPDAIADYEETAALVCALDLTISVCTAVVHLAGALGRPVWIMAPYAPEWRYGHTGTSMPWYPAARLFRQDAPGAWEPVLHRVSSALREHVRLPPAAST